MAPITNPFIRAVSLFVNGHHMTGEIRRTTERHTAPAFQLLSGRGPSALDLMTFVIGVAIILGVACVSPPALPARLAWL